MTATDAGNEFPTKAGCFQATADEFQPKPGQATSALQHGGMGDSGKIGGYLFATMILRALAAECALKALAAKSTGKYRREKRGHYLSKLYDDLTPEVRELIDSIAHAIGIAIPKTILEKLSATSSTDDTRPTTGGSYPPTSPTCKRHWKS